MVNVVGLFDTRGQAENVVLDLRAAGFEPGSMSIVASDPRNEYTVQTDDNHATITGEMAFKGAEGGAVVGGLIGLLAGLGAIAIPGVGLLIAGPLAGLALGAATGAVAGGLIGGLLGLGIPEEEAHVYAESIRRGSVMVTVHTDDARAEAAEAIMQRHNAVDIAARAAELRGAGFTNYDPSVPVMEQTEVVEVSPVTGVRRYAGVPPAQQVIFPASDGAVDDIYRTHYTTTYANSGVAYEELVPAYRYGYEVAALPQYSNQEWTIVEEQIRGDWETRYPQTWDARRQAIQAAYENARLRRTPRATVL